jgi:hypothetical protein
MLRCTAQVSKRIAATVRTPPVSAGEAASAIGALGVLGGFCFATFQLRLTKLGGFRWVSPCLQGGLFEEVAPALVPVRRALFSFEVLQGGLCVGSSLDDLDHSRGLVRTDVVTDYNVRSLEFFVCQMFSLLSRKQPYFESMRVGDD